MRKHYTLLGTSFLVIIVAVTGYYFITKTQRRPTETVTIGITKEPLMALIIIAGEKHFFSHEGLDVTLKYYRGGRFALEGMVANEVDLSVPAETPIIFASFERQDFSIIATIGSSDNELKLIARADHGIRKPQDLRGKRIATPPASPRFFLDLLLLKYGLSEEDVTFSVNRLHEELVSLLVNGDIDAFVTREPFLSQAKASLQDKAVIFTEPGLYLKTSPLVAFNNSIKDRPQTIKKILRALLKAEEFIKRYSEQAIEIVSHSTRIPLSEVRHAWTELNLTVSLEQSLIISLEDEARWAIKNKLTEKTQIPNYLNFIYPAALEAIKPEAVTIIR